MQTQILGRTVIDMNTSGKHMKCLMKEDLSRDGLTYKPSVSEPELDPNGVKIRVLATSVCGTDKSIYGSANNEAICREMRRHLPSASDYKPVIIGHEFCGIVEQVGENITAFQRKDVACDHIVEPGDYVSGEMHLSCGYCLLCRTGQGHICSNMKFKGMHLDGCFAQTLVLPHKNVILLGKGGNTSSIPPRIAAMLDAFGNAVHTLDEADVRGKSVAILGAGPLGLMSVFLAKAFGAVRIYLTEATDTQRRFSLGTEFGADQCFDISGGSSALYQSIEKHETKSNGVDVVLEMSGAAPAYNDAFHIVRNGGKVVLLGIPKKPLPNFDIANGIIWKGVTVKGIFGRKMFDTWETMLRLMHSNQFDIQSQLERIIGPKNYSLEQYQEVFELLASGKELKLVFAPNGPLAT